MFSLGLCDKLYNICKEVWICDSTDVHTDFGNLCVYCWVNCHPKLNSEIQSVNKDLEKHGF